ncbi:MAG TPA: hypothetical protein DEO65_08835 [Bacillus bacterium]|nr:hypothetical protein [Bacillus sp. (in: firmicutes)]
MLIVGWSLCNPNRQKVHVIMDFLTEEEKEIFEKGFKISIHICEAILIARKEQVSGRRISKN